MNVIAVNGSPRKDWNTSTLLKSAPEGAESVGARTELVHLYDLTYKGCTSCFSCKRKGNICGGLCNMRDDLRDLRARLRAMSFFWAHPSISAMSPERRGRSSSA